VEEFILKKAANHPRLRVIDRFGSAPQLTLQSVDHEEVVAIDGWKVDSIEEFLTERLLAGELPIE